MLQQVRKRFYRSERMFSRKSHNITNCFRSSARISALTLFEAIRIPRLKTGSTHRRAILNTVQFIVHFTLTSLFSFVHLISPKVFGGAGGSRRSVKGDASPSRHVARSNSLQTNSSSKA